MQREYFCGGCGLFHWANIYQMDEATGMMNGVPYSGCPNENCISHKEEGVVIFAVDTILYAYFAESYKEFINEIKWSSPKYAPEIAIEIYQKQGMPIRT